MASGRRLTTLALIAVGAMFALGFMQRVQPVTSLVLRVVVPGTVALVVLAAAHGTATALQAGLARLVAALGPVRAREEDDWGGVDELIKLLVGAPLLGSVCFLVACVTLSPAVLAATLALPALFSVVWLIGRRPQLSPLFAGSGPGFAALLLFAALLVGLAMAQLPPFTLDEVTYHLAVPRAYLLEGAVVELPLNSQSYFPSGVESLALPTMAVLGSIGAIAHHFVVLGLAVCTVLLTFGFLRRTAGLHAAWLGAAALGTTPALVLIAGTSWVDWALIGCTVALLVSLALLLEAEHFRADRLAWVVLAAAAGTACKYTFAGVLAALFLGAAVAVRFKGRRMLWLSLTAALGFALGSTFLVRNFLWTGNPVAPFLAEGAPRVAGFHGETGVLETVLGYVFEPGMADESLGGSLFTLCAAFVAGCAALRARSFLLASGSCGLVILLGAMALGAAGRLLVPFATIVALSGCVAVGELLAERSRAAAALRATVLACCALQVLFALSAADEHRPFSVLASDGSDGHYLASVRKNYAPIAWADANLPDGSKTLVLGTQELYWFRHRVRGAGNLDGPRVARYLAAADAEQLAARLARDGFTHVAIYHKGLIVGAGAEAGRAAESVTVLDAHAADVLRRLLSRGKLLGQEQGMSLHALRSSPPSGRAP